ncbi:MAG TPA: class I SAM-dependent methyltransferase [Anaeromyxobacteraceae bacterium]|nr:class I SAM-dependent methyltransferase [Anaeromyxobacteraceae bacterium]
MAADSPFDARAATWDADPAKVDRARRVAEAIAGEVPDLAGRSVLDYGAGTGLLGFELLPRVAGVTFADVSRGMLAEVEAKIARSGAANATAMPLDLSAGPAPRRFGLVVTLMAMHHVRDVPAMLRAFHGALEERGVLCVADLDEEDGSFHGAGFDGHRGFRREAFAGWLREAGFDRIRFSTPVAEQREVAGVVRTYPVFLAVADRSGARSAG